MVKLYVFSRIFPSKFEQRGVYSRAAFNGRTRVEPQNHISSNMFATVCVGLSVCFSSVQSTCLLVCLFVTCLVYTV